MTDPFIPSGKNSKKLARKFGKSVKFTLLIRKNLVKNNNNNHNMLVLYGRWKKYN